MYTILVIMLNKLYYLNFLRHYINARNISCRILKLKPHINQLQDIKYNEIF